MSTPKTYYVYILASPTGTLYTGMTGNLKQRIHQHRQKLIPGFTKKHNVTRLIHVESFSHVHDAIAREKQIKSWRREKKIQLINAQNPEWLDLAEPM
jgi:putative endonuclease